MAAALQPRWRRHHVHRTLPGGRGGYVAAAAIAAPNWNANFQPFIVKLNAEGGVEWQKHYHLPGHDINPRTFAAAPDGGYLVAGGDYDADTYAGFALKLSSGGDVEWGRRYSGGGGLNSLSVIH